MVAVSLEQKLTGDGTALTGVWFEGDDLPPGADERSDDDPVLVAAAEQLTTYFTGTFTQFDLPLAAAGTPFQQRVWTALRGIPYGTTVSYGVARGSATASGLRRWGWRTAPTRSPSWPSATG